jgi:hypothetical protein
MATSAHPPHRPVAALPPAQAPLRHHPTSPRPEFTTIWPSEAFTAAWILEALPLAPPTATTLASLCILARLLSTATPPLPLSQSRLRRPSSVSWSVSAPGLSRWTYGHLRAAIGISPTATTAILALMNLIISGYLPGIPSLHASALIAFAKPRGRGARPIAIGKVWVRRNTQPGARGTDANLQSRREHVVR